jgi:formylglycine-generating enzyme required for sulfatase activity
MPEGQARWYVNGTLVSRAEELRVTADRPLVITAITGDEPISPLRDTPTAAAADEAPAVPEPVRWRSLPPGVFTAGCTEGDDRCNENEWPRVSVALRGYELMDAEVTVEQYRAFARASGRATPRQPLWSGPQHPVVNLTWEEAGAFCAAADGRLPTEAEWEFAARGGRSEFAWSTGEVLIRDAVNAQNLAGRDQWAATAPVRSFPAGPFGLFDMTGNVWEWTADSYHGNRSTDPARDSGEDVKTIRGGSWDSRTHSLRVTRRLGLSVRGRHNLFVGFRCARSP